MGTVERVADVAALKASRTLATMGEELRNARLARGLSQAETGRVASVRQARVSYIERGKAPNASIRELTMLLASVGLDLSARTYPSGGRIRDRAQLALIERLRTRISPRLKWAAEVPLPTPGDDRAWDAAIEFDHGRLAIEAETKVRDVQALERRISLKWRDDPGIGQVLLLISATRTNRLALRTEASGILREYPLPARAMLAALAQSRMPQEGGVVML